MSSGPIRPEIPATPLDAAAITLVVDGRERPVRNSLDQPLHWSEEGVRNFWRWFGDSKAVDGDGKPLVVYHATNEKFTEFKTGEKDGLSGKGIYFSEYPLGQFGENVMSVYLRIHAPITRQTEVPGMREINSAGIPTKMVPDVLDQFPEFDGVINRMDITVKSPSQIKSATDNSGLFDPNTDRIDDPIVRPEIPATPLNAETLTLVVDGHERPVHNSRNQPLHWSEEGVRNFWRWFGNSKAVDADGRPLVLFHGTGADFTSFDINAGGDLAQFFTPSTEVAEWFAENGDKGWWDEYRPTVIPVVLAFQRPKTISARQLEELIGDPDDSTGIDWTSISTVVAEARKEGFDSICLTGTREYNGTTDDQWLAFHAEQIKSAIGNSGLFDPTTNHLADPMDQPVLAASMRRDIEGSSSMTSGPDDTTGTERNDSIVLIEPGQMAAFQKRLDGLNKKAVAFGLDPIKIIDTKDVIYERKFEYVGRDMDRQLSYLVPVQDGARAEHPVLLKRIEIEYPEVKLGNWRVIGKLEAMEGGNLTFAVSSDTADVAALSARADHPIECDHCKTNRQRKDGYLLRDNESGDYKQVGSNCLEDFTGHDPAKALFLARMSDVVRLAEGELEEFGRSSRANAVSTRGYLADVSFITENSGFMSSAKARDLGVPATYDEALALPRVIEQDRTLREKYVEQIERHLAHADAVRDWIATKPEESTFDRNVKLLLQADAIALDRKHLAFAAAAVPMYNRSLSAEAEARKPSEHVGTPGQKMAGKLTVDRVVQIEGYYGTSDLVLMHDEAGNRLKWKTSACPDEIRNGGVGRTMEASFKVKEHDDYKGTAQTAITHLKVTRWLDLEQSVSADVVDPAEHEPSAVLYRTSIYRHAAGDKDFSTPVIDATQLTSGQLVAEARDRGIDQLHVEGELVRYGSASDDLGKEFSLYVHDIDGREPSGSDYRQIAEMLGVELRAEAEVEHPALS